MAHGCEAIQIGLISYVCMYFNGNEKFDENKCQIKFEEVLQLRMPFDMIFLRNVVKQQFNRDAFHISHSHSARAIEIIILFVKS